MRHATKNRWIFGLCWVTYVSAYMGRINYSVAMEKMGEFFSVGTESLGIMGSAYFVSYAVGQLVNGFLGDRIEPRKFICTALVGAGTMNLAIAASSSYRIILVLWCLNGYFQSMFWGPLMRLLRQRFPFEKRSAVSTGMSATIIAGYIIVWTVLGQLLLEKSWREYFWIPSIVSAIVLALWIINAYISKSAPKTGQPLDAKTPSMSIRETLNNILQNRMWVFVLICLCMGLVKESIGMWTPMLVTRVLGLDLKQSPLYLLTFPLVNLLGILFSGWLVRRYKDNIRRTLLLLFSCVVCCALLLLISGLSPIMIIIFLSALSALMYGSQNILLGVVPLTLANPNMVAAIVGVLDFSSYMGAAISSVLISRILAGSSSMTVIVIIWLIFSVLAGLLSSTLRVSTPREAATPIHEGV